MTETAKPTELKKFLETPDYYACERCDTRELYAFLKLDHKERISASLFGNAAGHSVWETPIDCADTILGFSKEKAERVMIAAQNGITREPKAIEIYRKQLRTEVNPPFYAIPKWNIRIGGIPDGFVGTDGLLEVKSPDRMYKSIATYQAYQEQLATPLNNMTDTWDSVVGEAKASPTTVTRKRDSDGQWNTRDQRGICFSYSLRNRRKSTSDFSLSSRQDGR